MASTLSGRWKMLAILAVIALFLVVLILKTQQSQPADADAGASVTMQRGDAVAAFEQAQAKGGPIYLLFHSLTCDPCVEISANVDRGDPRLRG